MCNLMIVLEMGIIHENNNILFAPMCITLEKKKKETNEANNYIIQFSLKV